MRAPRIPSEIRDSFDESKQEGGEGLRLPDMLKLFVKAIRSFELVYLCLDAVDEVLRQLQSELLRALRQIIYDAPNARLNLTGSIPREGPVLYKLWPTKKISLDT